MTTANNKTAEKTLKMKAHQAMTVITGIAAIYGVNVLGRLSVMKEHGIDIPENLFEWGMAGIGVAAAAGFIALMTQPIPIKVSGMKEVGGTIYT